MKILILQLARFGDILQTWPTLKGLKRIYPNAQLHFLSRSKFTSAATRCPYIDKVWEFDTNRILEPSISGFENYPVSIGYINDLVEQLNVEKFDICINLSFSVFSSFLNYKIQVPIKKGYSVYADGTPHFTDKISSYFYAQVGVGRMNRIHVMDLFSKVAGLELIQDDYNFKTNSEPLIQEPYIVLHMGASQKEKCWPIYHWVQFIRFLTERRSEKIVLIGTQSEIHLGEMVLAQIQSPKLLNRIGSTTFSDLFDIIQYAQFFIGCDSAPLQIASLLQTPTINLSFSTVNFWETGPKSKESKVIFTDKPSDLTPEDLIEFVQSGESKTTYFSVGNDLQSFVSASQISNNDWDLIQLLYFDGPVPHVGPYEISRLKSIQQLSSECVQHLIRLKSNPFNKQQLLLIDIADKKIMQQLYGNLMTLRFWFETEKMNIGPGDVKWVILKTQMIYQRLNTIMKQMIQKNINKDGDYGTNTLETI